MDSKPGDEIPVQCLGETGALNFNKPTEQDLRSTQDLETALLQLDVFETPDEMTQRREALIRLQDICNEWIRHKASEQNLPSHIVNSTNGKVFTFGSYRLGVNFKGADIDSLLIVPRFITREEFFSEFKGILTDDPNVEDIYAVVDAFVPVLKMNFMGVQIDLLFAQIDQMNIASNFNLCENTEIVMRNMDERDVRSINGVRVTEDILNLVYNKNSFKVTLKVIRMWAKRRNIYSNALGFLGGVSWAILVARICQLYPYASPSMLVFLFFKIFSKWPWPKPVRLRESEYISSLGLLVWDPRYNPQDQYHLMPILTPSYPSQNSTYNVQRSNRIIIERELNHALSICEDILLRKSTWSALFSPAFFFRYRHYVVVVVTGTVKRAFVELCGLVESRLRVLVSNFELNRFVKMAHVNCQSYGKGPNDETEFVRKWFIGMEFDRNPNSLTNTASPQSDKPTLNVDLSEHINSFERSIERGLSSDDPSNTVSVKYAKKSQLSQYLSADDLKEIKRQALTFAKSNEKNSAALKSSDSNGNLHHTASTPELMHGNSPSTLTHSASSACVLGAKRTELCSAVNPNATFTPESSSNGHGKTSPELPSSDDTSSGSQTKSGSSLNSKECSPLICTPDSPHVECAVSMKTSSADDIGHVNDIKRSRLSSDVKQPDAVELVLDN